MEICGLPPLKHQTMEVLLPLHSIVLQIHNQETQNRMLCFRPTQYSTRAETAVLDAYQGDSGNASPIIANVAKPISGNTGWTLCYWPSMQCCGTITPVICTQPASRTYLFYLQGLHCILFCFICTFITGHIFSNC